MEDSDTSSSLSAKERGNSVVMAVEAENSDRQIMRSALKSLGFGGITDVPSHAAALEKIQERPVTHIIFDAKKTNMPPAEFVPKVLEIDPEITMIATSFEPNADDVFNLLCLGAKGYLVKPFTTVTIDLAITTATKGDPIPDSVKFAKNRNEALVAIALSSLDNLTKAMRQARQFESAEAEVPKAKARFLTAAQFSLMFAKDGEEGFLKALQEFSIEISKGPASRLGRLRKRLKSTRADET